MEDAGDADLDQDESTTPDEFLRPKMHQIVVKPVSFWPCYTKSKTFIAICRLIVIGVWRLDSQKKGSQNILC